MVRKIQITDQPMLEPKGYFALVLHAHLPFVRHPEHERFLEEDWFFGRSPRPTFRYSMCSKAWYATACRSGSRCR